MEAGVARTVIGELPAKNLFVEALGRLDVGGGKLDVVHLQIVFLLAHVCLVARLKSPNEISTWDLAQF